jgi:hypothetical protein
LISKVKTALWGIVVLFAFVMATPQKAAAYVDPGSGAMLWQAAAAMVLGLMFYIRRIRAWVGRLFTHNSSSEIKKS